MAVPAGMDSATGDDGRHRPPAGRPERHRDQGELDEHHLRLAEQLPRADRPHQREGQCRPAASQRGRDRDGHGQHRHLFAAAGVDLGVHRLGQTEREHADPGRDVGRPVAHRVAHPVVQLGHARNGTILSPAGPTGRHVRQSCTSRSSECGVGEAGLGEHLRHLRGLGETRHRVDLVEDRAAASVGQEEVDPRDPRAAERVEHGDGGVLQGLAVGLGERCRDDEPRAGRRTSPRSRTRRRRRSRARARPRGCRPAGRARRRPPRDLAPRPRRARGRRSRTRPPVRARGPRRARPGSRRGSTRPRPA